MKVNLLIENANIITMAGDNAPRYGKAQAQIGLIEEGLLAVAGDKIAFVGQGPLPEDFELAEDLVIIDAQGKLVTPGLIDSHTHLVHGGSREHEFKLRLEGVDYLDILAQGGGIHSTVKATRGASFDELYDQAKKSLDIMKGFGITTVEAKSGYGIGDFDTEVRQMEVARKLDEDQEVDIVSTFMGAHAIPQDYADRPDEFVDILIEDMLPKVVESGLAEFNDVFCEEGVFTVDQSRKILQAGQKLGLKAKIHADEIVQLGGGELAAEVGAISAEHLMAVSDQGIKDLAEKKVVAVLLPGTSFNMQNNVSAPARKMIEAGVPVAISTDYNPGSCPSENLQFMMSLASLMLKMTPAEVITAVTINAAAAIGREADRGSLEVGKKADIAIFDVPNLEYMLYHFGINHTDKVIKNGQVIFEK